MLLAAAPLLALRPAWAAAFTLLPPAVWCALGLALAALCLRTRRGLSLGLIAAWAIFGLIWVEPARSLLRPGYRIIGAARARPEALRIVTLNCAGGNFEAAREVCALAPDLVLLQECPGRSQLEPLAHELFGPAAVVLAGPDAAILAPGPMATVVTPRRAADFVMATVTLRGHALRVVSLRLQPPVGRVDLWNPECWRDQSESLRSRRAEIAAIIRFAEAHDDRTPLLIGGDFNAVAGDGAIHPLSALHDTFDEAGRGLCDTATNDFPFARIDRVFHSAGLIALASSVHRTIHSDHRLLVVDLIPSSN